MTETDNPLKALLIYLSPHGTTRRAVEALAAALTQNGLAADICDMREFEQNSDKEKLRLRLPAYPLIVFGSPTYFHHAPPVVTDFIRTLPDAGEDQAAAVLSTNLSLGAALFLRLAETAAGWYARAGAFEPSIVEWHRRGKADRPSGTARAIARRIVAVDPRWSGPDGADAADSRPALDVVGIRAGSNPGSHLVTFDGQGESIELRIAARDRTAYAYGALAAARWLTAERRAPGMHTFDAVVDDLLAVSA